VEEQRQNQHSRRLLEIADIVLCPSQWVASGCEKLVPQASEKIRVCPYGSSIATGDVAYDPEPGHVLFVGRDPLRKGLHYLARAARLVQDQVPESEFRIVGLLREQCDWIEDADALQFCGSIHRGLMAREYSRASLLVLPSLSEGQAGVVLEAMAGGCPVIITRESGVDLQPDAGITVPARDPEALAEAIERVLRDDELRRKLSQGARRQVLEEFTMEAWQERLVKVLESVVEQ
jgi:glycosyltransferase involved in cell wall biosynthesis